MIKYAALVIIIIMVSIGIFLQQTNKRHKSEMAFLRNKLSQTEIIVGKSAKIRDSLQNVILSKDSLLSSREVFIKTDKNRFLDIDEVLQGVLKPVIYLYPEKSCEISVTLNFKGNLLTTYPKISKENNWTVIANPDGEIINKADGQTYSYLFWDGITNDSYSIPTDSGFLVKGSETQIFLQKTLKEIGLTAKEYNEMIAFWLPKMERNEYNQVYFVGKLYTNIAVLKIKPIPNSLLRVFMVFRKLKSPIDLKPQKFSSFKRNYFTVIEWGGSEIINDEFREFE